MNKFKRFIKHYIRSWDDNRECAFDRSDETVEVIRDVEKKAIDLTLPDIARHCQKVTTSLLALRSARLFLCECLAMLPKGASDDLLTVTEVAGRLKVNRDKVLGWIHYSRLRAANTAKGALGRPRWRIKKSDLEDFLAGRTG